MASGPIISRQMDGATMEIVTDFYFPGLQNHTSKPPAHRVAELDTTERLNNKQQHESKGILSTATSPASQQPLRPKDGMRAVLEKFLNFSTIQGPPQRNYITLAPRVT